MDEKEFEKNVNEAALEQEEQGSGGFEGGSTGSGDNMPANKRMLIASVIILALLLLGGVYAFDKLQKASGTAENESAEYYEDEFDMNFESPESKSDEPEDIEKDLLGTDLDSLDSDLQSLDNI